MRLIQLTKAECERLTALLSAEERTLSKDGPKADPRKRAAVIALRERLAEPRH